MTDWGVAPVPAAAGTPWHPIELTAIDTSAADDAVKSTGAEVLPPNGGRDAADARRDLLIIATEVVAEAQLTCRPFC